ncbi:uncharacterized protein LOC117182992 [Belonocnema kinseyi]|uniref:uncharacterized protein LOC117182992 n=1 Tax=Belonocnema kinseyi TaxID=2817044 RepID=UPI00143E0265|nr:uncharacterized protein LOC117182992 [Belonocnema kinseyi]
MNFFSLIVLLSTDQILEASSSSELRKCCSTEEVLQDVEGNLSCVEVSSLTVEINNLGPRGLPDCRSSKGFFFMSLNKIREDNLHVSKSACLDNLHNNETGNNLPIIVYCDDDAGDLADSEISSKIPHVLSAKKCCPPGQYFKVDEKSCVFGEAAKDFKSFLNLSDEVDLFTLGVGSPICEDALVNYVTESAHVYKNNGKVMKGAALRLKCKSEISMKTLDNRSSILFDLISVKLTVHILFGGLYLFILLVSIHIQENHISVEPPAYNIPRIDVLGCFLIRGAAGTREGEGEGGGGAQSSVTNSSRVALSARSRFPRNKPHLRGNIFSNMDFFYSVRDPRKLVKEEHFVKSQNPSKCFQHHSI